MKQTVLGLVALVCISAMPVQGQHKLTVERFNQAGPFRVSAPLAFDSVGVGGKAFDEASLMNAVSLKTAPTTVFSGHRLPSVGEGLSVGVLSFFLNNSDYLKGSISVKGPKKYKLYIDGREASGDLKLAPEHHTFCIRYLAQPSDTDSISVTLDTQLPAAVTTDSRHPYMAHDLFDGRRVRGVSLSADGSYVCVSYRRQVALGLRAARREDTEACGHANEEHALDAALYGIRDRGDRGGATYAIPYRPADRTAHAAGSGSAAGQL